MPKTALELDVPTHRLLRCLRLVCLSSNLLARFEPEFGNLTSYRPTHAAGYSNFHSDTQRRRSALNFCSHTVSRIHLMMTPRSHGLNCSTPAARYGPRPALLRLLTALIPTT